MVIYPHSLQIGRVKLEPRLQSALKELMQLKQQPARQGSIGGHCHHVPLMWQSTCGTRIRNWCSLGQGFQLCEILCCPDTEGEEERSKGRAESLSSSSGASSTRVHGEASRDGQPRGSSPCNFMCIGLGQFFCRRSLSSVQVKYLKEGTERHSKSHKRATNTTGHFIPSSSPCQCSHLP